MRVIDSLTSWRRLETLVFGVSVIFSPVANTSVLFIVYTPVGRKTEIFLENFVPIQKPKLCLQTKIACFTACMLRHDRSQSTTRSAQSLASRCFFISFITFPCSYYCDVSSDVMRRMVIETHFLACRVRDVVRDWCGKIYKHSRHALYKLTDTLASETIQQSLAWKCSNWHTCQPVRLKMLEI